MLPVDTSGSPTALLNESQIGWLWGRIDLGTWALCVLAFAMVWKAAGFPTISDAVAWYRSVSVERVPRWYRWRIVGPEPPVPVDTMVTDVVVEHLDAHIGPMTKELLDAINERAAATAELLVAIQERTDQTDQRVSALSEDVGALTSEHEKLRTEILRVDETAKKAQKTQAHVVTMVDRAATGPFSQ